MQISPAEQEDEKWFNKWHDKHRSHDLEHDAKKRAKKQLMRESQLLGNNRRKMLPSEAESILMGAPGSPQSNQQDDAVGAWL